MKIIYKLWLCLVFTFFLASCAKTPQPLTYLCLEKPKGIISTNDHKEVNKSFSRGGFYFLNYNFRPAADIKNYIEQAEKDANTGILRNADIQTNVPFAFDILFFGYNNGTDTITAKK